MIVRVRVCGVRVCMCGVCACVVYVCVCVCVRALHSPAVGWSPLLQGKDERVSGAGHPHLDDSSALSLPRMLHLYSKK